MYYFIGTPAAHLYHPVQFNMIELKWSRPVPTTSFQKADLIKKTPNKPLILNQRSAYQRARLKKSSSTICTNFFYKRCPFMLTPIIFRRYSVSTLQKNFC